MPTFRPNSYRTHTCGQLRPQNVGQKVVLSGWLFRKRDHGGVAFLDLRDFFGVTQCVVGDKTPNPEELEKIPLESVLTAEGEVVARGEDMVNPSLATGEIEVRVLSWKVLAKAHALPFPIAHAAEYPEELRYKYRYLDLRLQRHRELVQLHGKVVASLRKRMRAEGFLEFQTPILSASSPEGSRDFIVPSRLHPGKFYALPQAPQLYKQLCMAAGFERYFQIAPCFRDEDARQNRAPGEFYQCDFEMAFATQDDVFATFEPILSGLFQEFASKPSAVDVPPFCRIRYQDAMERFGTDKPDLRNPLELMNVSSTFAGGSFTLFAKIVAQGGKVVALPVPKLADAGRAYLDRMNAWAREQGQGGLGYITWSRATGKGQGPIAKNLGEEHLHRLESLLSIRPGDGVFFGAGLEPHLFMTKVRDAVGQSLGFIDPDVYRFCWITDFPLFEPKENGGWEFSHNPFSMPQGGLKALEGNPGDVLAYQYDIVCNGVELSSGALRTHDLPTLYKAFSIAGYKKQDVDRSFPALVEALKYGAPPSGGSAPGIERIVMLLAGAPNIREITLFPKNQMGQDLMLGAPNNVTPTQLEEVHIALALRKNA